MKRVLLFGALQVVAACTHEVAALVDCEVTEGPVVECAAKQTQGRSAIEVCWDFSVTCANQATLEAKRICQRLQDGGARNVMVPTARLKMSGACEGEAKGAVTNMTINGKATN
jgi:hypothetical protein